MSNKLTCQVCKHSIKCPLCGNQNKIVVRLLGPGIYKLIRSQGVLMDTDILSLPQILYLQKKGVEIEIHQGW